MKNIGLLSTLFLLLTGCVALNDSQQSYSYDNLRAPSQPYQNATKAVEAVTPQSITQPLNINPVPETAAVAAPVSSQQPLVQTIVIPQYTPQPGMLPYVPQGYSATTNIPQPSFNTPAPSATPAQGTAPITIPNMPAVSAPVQQMPANTTTMPTQIQLPGDNMPIHVPDTQIKTSDFINKQGGQIITEEIYPAWAASNFEAPKPATQSASNEIVYLKNPNRNEIVQCAAVDIMCIASYQQQGYMRTNATESTQPVAPRPKNNTGYPRTDWNNESIPRW